MEALATLVCGIAHDVNNMLQVILGASQLLLLRKDNGDRSCSHIQYIIDMVDEGAALVKKLRLFGKQAGCQPVRMDLNHKIRELNTSMCGSLPKTVHIKLELSDEPATIRADNNHVAHVVTNLVTNASEAMPNGGRINIATEIVSLDAEYCTRHHGAKPGNYVMLLVSDNGIGMDSQTMGRIFDPFFSKKEWCSIMGTGLGLSVARAIVEQHGGHITCESELDKGTVFKAYFPAVDAPAIIDP